MRIVILSETFTKRMGYCENMLPKALSRLGEDVHVVATNLQAGHNSPDYKQTYEPFLGPAVRPCGVEQHTGFTLHRLPHRILLGYPRIRGLTGKLRELRPDIVQVHAAASWLPLEAAFAQPRFGFQLFTGAHQTASVVAADLKSAGRLHPIRLKSDLRRALPGRLVSFFARKCYAATVDCAEIARRFYGVPQKQIDICPLGVDTELFHPVRNEADCQARCERRQELGVRPDEIVCIYTGRFSLAKNPVCLAQAIAQLNEEGRPVRGLFVGDGPQRAEIEQFAGSQVHPFVSWGQLPSFYRAADIGVWPTQESMSMLDAAASGLPVVVSDRLVAVERVEGNGLQYREGDAGDLARQLRQLEDSTLRTELGKCGADKIAREFSWLSIAERRLADYQVALRGPAAVNGHGRD